MPKITPMLPTSKVTKDDESYIYEIKWDGYRCIAYLEGKKVNLESRNLKILNSRFPSIVQALQRLNRTCILDGEVVAFSEIGKPDFELLRNYGQPKNLCYIAFDLLFWEKVDLCSKPWWARRALLEELFEEISGRVIRISPVLPGTLNKALAFAREQGLEGIISKKKESPYESGVRSDFWRKHKLIKTMDCVVIGINLDANRIRSCKVALYEARGNLKYMGNVGSGLGENELQFLKEATTLLTVSEAPVVTDEAEKEEVIWFKPHLVIEVSYLEITSAGRIRHPVFLRFRFDKNASDCLLGVEKP